MSKESIARKKLFFAALCSFAFAAACICQLYCTVLFIRTSCPQSKYKGPVSRCIFRCLLLYATDAAADTAAATVPVYG